MGVVSVYVCQSILVVGQHAEMLLTPLTPYKTRLNARDRGPKHGWRSEVRRERLFIDEPLVASTGRRTPFTEIKAGQDAKHSKTERLQTVVFVQHC